MDSVKGLRKSFAIANVPSSTWKEASMHTIWEASPAVVEVAAEELWKATEICHSLLPQRIDVDGYSGRKGYITEHAILASLCRCRDSSQALCQEPSHQSSWKIYSKVWLWIRSSSHFPAKRCWCLGLRKRALIFPNPCKITECLQLVWSPQVVMALFFSATCSTTSCTLTRAVYQ